MLNPTPSRWDSVPSPKGRSATVSAMPFGGRAGPEGSTRLGRTDFPGSAVPWVAGSSACHLRACTGDTGQVQYRISFRNRRDTRTATEVRARVPPAGSSSYIACGSPLLCPSPEHPRCTPLLRQTHRPRLTTGGQSSIRLPERSTPPGRPRTSGAGVGSHR